jgi:RNA polymerase sigma-70 factor (ECF subfamily)
MVPAMTGEAEAEGGTASFAGFFEETRKKAYCFALHLVGEREEAMDITQEAYLRLHTRWERRDRTREPKAWLYSVIRNLAIDHLRRRARRPEAEMDQTLLRSPGAGPERAAQQNELAAWLWEAIRRLPPEQQEILLLRDWHGLDYGQIAEVLGLSMGTVSSRLHHAREKVREQMRRYL